MARRRLPVVPRRPEVDALLAAAPDGRDRLALPRAPLLGLRVSEVTKLEVSDLDLAERRAHVRQGKGDKDRYVPIPPRLVEPLQTWLAGRTVGYLFPGRGGRRLSSR